MSARSAGARLAALLAVLALAPAASAYDAQQTFQKGSLVVSVEGGFGEQDNLEGHRRQTGLELWNLGVRISVLPFGPTGSGFFYGAFEAGLEPFYVRYTDPVDASWAGLAAVFRYHFLSLGRVVPWVEAFAGAGGTDLDVREIRTDFAFVLQAGLGASLFVGDRTALYGGYRLLHVSNGNIESPNRGFEAHTGVFGVSFFFP